VIDRARRDKLAAELTALIDGEMTNDDFDLASPDAGADVAVLRIWEFGNCLYSSDLPWSYRLAGQFAVPPDVREEAGRCVLFLQTDLPYEWPKWFRTQTAYGLESLGCFALFGVPLAALALFALWKGQFQAAAMFGMLPLLSGGVGTHWLLTRRARAEEERHFWARGDKDVWPFLRRAEYYDARRKQPL
jgi:hypothetical protein